MTLNRFGAGTVNWEQAPCFAVHHQRCDVESAGNEQSGGYPTSTIVITPGTQVQRTDHTAYSLCNASDASSTPSYLHSRRLRLSTPQAGRPICTISSATWFSIDSMTRAVCASIADRGASSLAALSGDVAWDFIVTVVTLKAGASRMIWPVSLRIFQL